VFPYSLGVLTALQGLYALLFVIVLVDLGSPTLDLRSLPEWTDSQFVFLAAALLSIMFPLGVAMQTVSRNLFRKTKDLWDMEVLTSPSVTRRMEDLGCAQPIGAPALGEVHAAEHFDRVRKAGEFMHAVDYELQIRAPHVRRSIQVYRDEYRIARGFILPSLMLALVLPFWEPVPAGHVGSFPLISFQLFFLCVFFAGVAMYAFKERARRYAAERVRSYMTVEAEARRSERKSVQPLAAVG